MMTRSQLEEVKVMCGSIFLPFTLWSSYNWLGFEHNLIPEVDDLTGRQAHRKTT